MRFRWLALLLAVANAHAVILYRTGDPNENTTPPSGANANSGWQYQGIWGGFLGTPIAPHFFISAAHIGNAGGSSFTFQNVTYRVTQDFFDPQSDLVIWRIAGEFPSFAPLYSRTDEVGQRIIAIGRGTRRGDPVTLNEVFKGWYWGAGDGVERWGENTVSSIYQVTPAWDLLRAEFNAGGLPNECHLSVGDSGGAAFIDDNGTWKLAGIHYSVDGDFSFTLSHESYFDAALVEMDGLYAGDHNSPAPFEPVTGPSALYPTRISTKLPWIAIMIAEAQIGFDAGAASLTYTKLVIPQSDLVYGMQQSSDLVNWQAATTSDQVLSTNASTEIVKSKITTGSAPALFLRLRAQRP